MSKHGLKVAMGISRLAIGDLINRSRVICDAILSNPVTFATPSPAIAVVQTATDELEIAAADAADGGKTKTAVMRDKQDALLKLLYDVGHYVEGVANGDTDIIHLASMQEKTKSTFHRAEFSVEPADDPGGVFLRVKPRSKTSYTWQHTLGPLGTNPWITDGVTVVASMGVGPLERGQIYWFRVIFNGPPGGTIPYEPISILVP